MTVGVHCVVTLFSLYESGSLCVIIKVIVYDRGIVGVITSLYVPVLKTISYPGNERLLLQKSAWILLPNIITENICNLEEEQAEKQKNKRNMLQITFVIFVQGDNIRLYSPHDFCTFSFFVYFWYLNLDQEFVHIRITTKCAVT
jgi:hypothetical protein